MQLSATISLTLGLACHILLLCLCQGLVLEEKLTPEDTLTPQQDSDPLYGAVARPGQGLVLEDTLTPQQDSDPLSTACQQMCREEDRQMMECAKRHGCAKILEPSEFHISTYKKCMKPCFKVSSSCFSLCSENYNNMVSRCINIVGSVNEKMDCLFESFQEINTSKPL